MRKGFTIYPSTETRRMLDVIGEKTDRVAGKVAVRFIDAGIRRWMRKASTTTRQTAGARA
jgi:hypothetical protein